MSPQMDNFFLFVAFSRVAAALSVEVITLDEEFQMDCCPLGRTYSKW